MYGKRESRHFGFYSGLISVFAVLFVSTSLALAQAGVGKGQVSPQSADTPPKADSPGDKTIQPGIRIQSNLVTAPVTVTNKVTGEFVYDLDMGDFLILDNGRPQQITEFAREPNKVAAVILIQNNEAVEPLLNEIRQLAPMFSQLMLGPKGEAAVITFGTTIHVDQHFSNSEATLDKTLHTITADGTRARLNDALMQAMNLLEHRPRGERRVILVFSSGNDSGSETANSEVVRRATRAQVEIYGLGLSLTKSYLSRDKQPMNAPNTPENASGAMPPTPGVPNTPSSSMGRFGVTVPATGAIKAAVHGIPGTVRKNDVESYARLTGGIFYSQWTSKTLQVHLSEIAADIHSQYVLAYVPDDLSENGFHRLEVRVRKDGVKVRTRQGYFYEGRKR
ncbi:MAG: VWA domain-containing protein [Acidobacteriota bacterium]